MGAFWKKIRGTASPQPAKMEGEVKSVEVFHKLLRFTSPSDYERFVFRHELSSSECELFKSKLTRLVNADIANEMKRESYFQLAVLGLHSTEVSDCYAHIGESLRAGGRAGKQHLFQAFIDGWPLYAFLVFQYDAKNQAATMMKMGLMINWLQNEFGQKRDLADEWPFVRDAFAMCQATIIAKLTLQEESRHEAIERAVQLDVFSGGLFGFTPWLKEILEIPDKRP